MKKSNKMFIGYKLVDDTTYKTLNIKNEYIYTETFDLMLLKTSKKNKDVIKVIKEDIDFDNNDIIFDRCDEKLFLQIVLMDKNNSYEIQEYIDSFLVDGNVILDKTFLIWYMRYYYSQDISNDYKLRIIDNNVNMFNLDNTQKIEITNEESGWKYDLINSDK